MRERENARKWLRDAQASGARALSEHESKQVLQAYGIAVVEEALAADGPQASGIAERIGYPVAVKACGRALQHKTDRGLVHLNVSDAAGVRDAAARIREALDDEAFDGFLVQRMARGKREVIIGGVRDPVFGPCVMFGTGGIAVEALGDVAFRLAPLSERDALEMLAEVQSTRVLDALRGEPPADRAALAAVLQRVGEMLADLPEIAQLDINPLIIQEGLPLAVDALIALAPQSTPVAA